MPSPQPIRITRTGRMGRADLDTAAGRVTVITASPGSIARAAVAARRSIGRLSADQVPGTISLRSAVDLDLAVEQAAEAAGCGVTVTMAGDVSIAGPSPAPGWRIGLRDWSIRMPAGGLATARNQGPDGAWRSITVAANTWRAARTAAGRALERGQEAAVWLGANDLRARLVRLDGTITYSGIWPLEQPAA
ncbi:MAG TPA: hypothetical protein VG435_13170 [Acidimicrobiales bacterium]|jgi:thiamine biosynthesis lipoprotein|nr:hypothetical protein [Acidimicrobiales bacterium]